MGKAMELVEQLAVKLGVAVEYLWSLLVKQQFAEGIIDLILAALCIFVLIVISLYAPKLYKKADNEYKRIKSDRLTNSTGYDGSRSIPSLEEDKWENRRDNIPCIAMIIAIAAFIFTLFFIVFGVQQVINPEYFAFKEILDVISAG